MDSRRNNDERGSINERIKNLNRRIRRANNKRNKDRLIQERERLKLGESNEWDPRELHGAFGGAYRRYRIDGVERMDVETFFNRTRNYIKNLIIKETKGTAARTQAITWIRFTRDEPSGCCTYSKFAYSEEKCKNSIDNCSHYRGQDCVSKFCEHMISEAKRLYKSILQKAMTPLTN